MKVCIVFILATVTSALSTARAESFVNNDATYLNFGPDAHVAKNNIVEFFDYPFSVSLWFKSNKRVVKYCGAARLSKNWFITSASCLENIKFYDEVQLMHASAVHNYKNYAADTVTGLTFELHPGYNEATKVNDIAVFKRSIDFYDGHRPSLPGTKNIPTRKYENVPVIAYKWRNSTTPTDFEDRLELIAVQGIIVEEHFCKLNYPVTSDKHLCVSMWNGEAFTENDAGVPLVINDGTGHLTLVGLASSVRPLKKAGVVPSPVLFTLVTPYLEWMYLKSGKEIPSWN